MRERCVSRSDWLVGVGVYGLAGWEIVGDGMGLGWWGGDDVRCRMFGV